MPSSETVWPWHPDAGEPQDEQVVRYNATLKKWYYATIATASIPTGVITMWSGLLANIPSGWALCDGTQGTPDLRNSFIKSVGAAEEPGAIGGSATHTHAAHPALSHVGGAVVSNTAGLAVADHAAQAHSGTAVADHAAQAHSGTAVADHASHTHDYSQVITHTHTVNVSDPGHTHIETNNSATTGGLAGWAARDTSTNTQVNTGYSTVSNTTGITATTVAPGGSVTTVTTTGPSATLSHVVTQPSDHPILTHSVTQPNTHPALVHSITDTGHGHTFTQPSDHASQTHDTVNHEPTFFKLAYIMKL